MSTKELSIKIPGKPVPYVRTTQRQKYYSRQYQRYECYKAIVILSYLLARLELKLKSMPKQKQTEIIFLRESAIVYRDMLLKTINKSNEDILNNNVEVKIEDI